MISTDPARHRETLATYRTDHLVMMRDALLGSIRDWTRACPGITYPWSDDPATCARINVVLMDRGVAV